MIGEWGRGGGAEPSHVDGMSSEKAYGHGEGRLSLEAFAMGRSCAGPERMFEGRGGRGRQLCVFSVGQVVVGGQRFVRVACAIVR